jgi:hypothetical protein
MSSVLTMTPVLGIAGESPGVVIEAVGSTSGSRRTHDGERDRLDRYGPGWGLVAGLTAGGICGFLVGLTYSWMWATALTFIQLRRSGNGPLRLLRFLEDARAQDVLRTAGSVYQFRHARLQDRLACRFAAADVRHDTHSVDPDGLPDGLRFPYVRPLERRSTTVIRERGLPGRRHDPSPESGRTGGRGHNCSQSRRHRPQGHPRPTFGLASERGLRRRALDPNGGLPGSRRPAGTFDASSARRAAATCSPK